MARRYGWLGPPDRSTWRPFEETTWRRWSSSTAPGPGSATSSPARCARRSSAGSAGARAPGCRPAATSPPTCGCLAGVVVAAYEQLDRRGSAGLAARLRHGRRRRSPRSPRRPRRDPLRTWSASSTCRCAPGVPDLGMFPRTTWRRAYERALAAATDADLDYGDPAGAPRLRAELAGYLGRVRAARVTAGRPGRDHRRGAGVRAAWPSVLRVARRRPRSASRTRAAPASAEHLDAHGLRAGADPGGRRRPRRATRSPGTGVPAVLVTPAHQFPTGVVLAPARRAALVDWARRTGGLVIEDDYDAEFRYDRDPVGCLQGLAPDVVALPRLGQQGARPGAAARLARRTAGTAGPRSAGSRRRPTSAGRCWSSWRSRSCWRRGGYDRHLRRARRPHRERRDALVAALRRHLPGRADRPVSPPGCTWSWSCRPASTTRRWRRGRGPPVSARSPLSSHPAARPADRPGWCSATPRIRPRPADRGRRARCAAARRPLGSGACREFVPLAERIVDALLESDPALAASAGDHRFDDRLPDLSPDARRGRGRHAARRRRRAVRRWTPTRSTPQERVDHAMLSSLGRARAVRADRGARARVEPAARTTPARCCTR